MDTLQRLLLPAFLLLITQPAYAGGNDDPLLGAVFVEQLEWREDDELVWDAEAWLGKDQNKLWLKTEGERNSDSTEEFETQALLHRAISPYWNMQVGWRGDWQPQSRRSWAAVGVSGLAPGFIETEVTAFLASGRSAVRIKGSYELHLTQRFVLIPWLEANWYSDDDAANEQGDGLADLEMALRLHYAIRPDLRPYVGLSYTGWYGDTADYISADGERDRSLQALLGLSFWF
jgi:copper resistance protein B